MVGMWRFACLGQRPVLSVSGGLRSGRCVIWLRSGNRAGLGHGAGGQTGILGGTVHRAGSAGLAL